MVRLGLPTTALAAIVSIMELPIAFAVAVGAFTHLRRNFAFEFLNDFVRGARTPIADGSASSDASFGCQHERIA